MLTIEIHRGLSLGIFQAETLRHKKPPKKPTTYLMSSVIFYLKEKKLTVNNFLSIFSKSKERENKGRWSGLMMYWCKSLFSRQVKGRQQAQVLWGCTAGCHLLCAIVTFHQHCVLMLGFSKSNCIFLKNRVIKELIWTFYVKRIISP